MNDDADFILLNAVTNEPTRCGQFYINGVSGSDFSIRAGRDFDGNLELVIYSDSEEVISSIRGVTTTDGATHRINYTPPRT